MSDIPQGFTIRVMDDNDGSTLDRNVWFGFANGFRVSMHMNENTAELAGYPRRDPPYSVTSPVADVAVFDGTKERSHIVEIGRLTPDEVLAVLGRVAALAPGAVLDGVFDEVDA
jgi:hypothetical protein